MTSPISSIGGEVATSIPTIPGTSPVIDDDPVHRKNVVYLKVFGANNVVMIHQDEEMRIPTSEIRDLIRIKLERNPKLMVSMKTSENAPYGAMIDVLDELRVADARRISIGPLRGT